MIKTSSTISKIEFPNLDSNAILNFFKEEFEKEGINQIYVNSADVKFRNEKFHLSFGGGKNKFIGFDNGCIKVDETDTNFNLKFSSSSKKTYLLFSKLSLALLILACYISGITWNSIMVGIVAFFAFSFEYTVHTYLNVSQYFSRIQQK